MSEKTEPEAMKEPKKRGKRKQSSYLVLKSIEVLAAPPTSPDYEPPDYNSVAEGASIKSCIKAIEDGKITGNLIIVCVRRRLISELQETLKLS